jgi:hypothetical protein
VIEVYVPDEHSVLQTVIMRYAGECTIDLSQPDRLDPVLQRQRQTSSWQPYDPAIVRAEAGGQSSQATGGQTVESHTRLCRGIRTPTTGRTFQR